MAATDRIEFTAMKKDAGIVIIMAMLVMVHTKCTKAILVIITTAMLVVGHIRSIMELTKQVKVLIPS